LTKIGSGLLTLTGTDSYTGATIVSNGTLRASGSLTGTGPVFVRSGATLGGLGAISGPVSVELGAILSPGASVGTLTINSNLTVAGNLLIEVNKSLAQSNDFVQVSGTLTNAGTGILTVTNLGTIALTNGDKFTLFSKPLLNGGALTISPATPGQGLAWVNNPAVNGSIAVVSGVSTVPTNITYSVTAGSMLQLSWPADHVGWHLQTNVVSLAARSSWFNLPGSETTNLVNLPFDHTKTNVFFRLVSP
jgi:autotransporter-associated beta strand protein